MEPSGLGNYLGDRFDPDTGRWEERYGRRAKITLGLDLYAPEKGDGALLQAAFDALAEALLLGEPEGLAVEEFSCGQTVRDGESRRLKRPADAVCTAWLSAGTDAGGAFTDFDLEEETAAWWALRRSAPRPRPVQSRPSPAMTGRWPYSAAVEART